MKSLKLGIYFDGFNKDHVYKDPGLLYLGLKEKGIEVSLITLKKKELKGINHSFDLIQIDNPIDLEVFENFDAFIVYSWLSVKYNKLIKTLKKLNKIVIIKSDSDGRIASFKGPKPRFRFTTYFRNPIYQIPVKFFKEFFLIGYYVDLLKVKQIDYADFLIIESPDAAQNLSYFLSIYKRTDLIKKINVIPNPVADDFINIDSYNYNKENIIISVGSWDDIIQKNTKLLIKTIIEFLKIKENWEVILIGSGNNIFKNLISKIPIEIQKRINILGVVNHEEIKRYLLKSKIFFLPSKFEGCPISVAEALCCGCTILGTPIESLRFFSMCGFSGNTASSFNIASMIGSLIYEAEKHEKFKFEDYKRISEYWKNRLNKNKIADKYLDLL